MKIQFSKELLRLMVRLLAAGVAVATSFALWTKAGHAGFVGGFAYALMGCGALILAAVIMAKPFADFIGERAGGLFSLGERGKPQPMYSIPLALEKRGQYEQAIAKYLDIAAQFPDEARPYAAAMEIAMLRLNSRERMEQFYQQGMTALKDQKKKDALERSHQTLLKWNGKG